MVYMAYFYLVANVLWTSSQGIFFLAYYAVPLQRSAGLSGRLTTLLTSPIFPLLLLRSACPLASPALLVHDRADGKWEGGRIHPALIEASRL